MPGTEASSCFGARILRLKRGEAWAKITHFLLRMTYLAGR